ncbi:hypothetical protein Sango_0804000 [Sesamum angolense]|uniref:DUF4283 domain-containing protein n=1 Tax=Sesamum angolense TaxID=2727404 RepID=A0AAE1X437_9LAMI|nr:hypothetical protein Sango_0804000 [Sesamum angolense]
MVFSMAKYGMELGPNLSLTEDEEARVVIPNSDWNCKEDSRGFELALVGRFLSHRNTNFDALRNTLLSILQPVKGMTLRRISKDRFCIHFNHQLDLQRTLEGRPWTFKKNLRIINPIQQNSNPTEICLDWYPFTVFVHDLPLSQHTRAMAKHIGNIIGRFLDIELPENGLVWSSALKLKNSAANNVDPIHSISGSIHGIRDITGEEYSRESDSLVANYGKITILPQTNEDHPYDPNFPSSPQFHLPPNPPHDLVADPSHTNTPHNISLPTTLTLVQDHVTPMHAKPTYDLPPPTIIPPTAPTTIPPIHETYPTYNTPNTHTPALPHRAQSSLEPTLHNKESNSILVNLPLTLSDPFNLGPLIAKSKPKRYTNNKITKRKPLTQSTHTRTGKRKLPPSFFAFEELEVRLGKRTATLESKPMDEDVGHFNAILSDTEKESSNPTPPRHLRYFRLALGDSGLFDVAFSGHPFTWCNNREHSSTVWKRLDRACTNSAWNTTWPETRVSHLR